jgi:DNA-binding transcriptional regulator YbjK
VRASKQSEVDRRTAIADSSIVVLSREGTRGLTHRAVDRQLSLPEGSTSYYFRTRAALTSCAADRLVALDMADVDGAGDHGRDVVLLLAHWMAPAQRVRLLARFQLFVEATRDSTIRALLAEPRKAFVAHATEAMRKAGAVDAKLAALVLVSVVDGLLLNELIGEHVSANKLERVLGPLQEALLCRA